MNDFDETECKINKLRQRVLYIMLGTVYLSFIGVQLARVSALNQTVYEFLFLPAYVGILIVPVMLLIYFFLSFKLFKINRYLNPFDIRKILSFKFIMIVLSILMIFMILIFQSFV